MSSKDKILTAVKNNIKDKNFSSLSPRYVSPMKISEDSLLKEYIKNQIVNKSQVLESNNALKDLNELLEKIGAKQVICNADLPLNIQDIKGNFSVQSYTKSVDEFRDEIFGIDTSVVLARVGVANLGIVGISSNELAPRLSSLVTNRCIYLLKKENIVENLSLAMKFIKNYEQERTNSSVLPSNIVFIAGPSRTADIELQTVFGVHGPRETFVILY